jgi:signal transduction histidine kinase
MDGSVPLQFWYVSIQVVSALVLAATGYLVATRTDTHDRTAFVAYIAIQGCWLLAATAKVLVYPPVAKYALSLLTDLLAVGAIGIVGYFATVYTNRSASPRQPQNALFLGWVVVAVVVLVSFVYLARLFISSNHRPTSSILLLVAAAVASLLPNLLSTLTRGPLLPGYDYTVFGIVPLTVILAYTVFFRGELDLAPMARTEIVDTIDDALFGLDDAGRLIDYNAAAEPLLPDDVTTPVGRELSRLLPCLAAEISLPDAGDGELSATYSTVVDGARTHYSVSVSPILERSTVAGYTVVLRDVTAVESSKRELTRQNDQLESFASTVAHDLRNPLQVADGAATLLGRQLQATEGPAAAEGADHLDRVGEAIGRMDARLDELRTLAEHGQSVTVTEPVAFGAAVRAVWREGDTDGPSLSVAADGTIEAERGRLDSILEQLLRHSAERGAARVEVALTETGFTFEDDGSEIPEPDLEAVFESGTTTASDSAGLGLEIVRAQVESQGWQVCVERTATGVAFVVTGGTTTVETEGSR